MANYPEHLRGFSYRGPHRYSLTFCTLERRPLFKEAATVRLADQQFLRAERECAMRVIAYCFMPDHVHLVVEGTDVHADLKAFTKLAKQYSGYYYASCHDGEKLWQRYGYEHVLRDNESTQRTVRYVLENPVRRGLVTHPREYPHLGSHVYSLEQLLEFAYGVAEQGVYQAG